MRFQSVFALATAALFGGAVTFATLAYVKVSTTVVCPQPEAQAAGGKFFTGREIPTTGGEPLRFQSR
jgi:hypothetical protein